MRKELTVFSLTMITVGSVDSIRNLPAAAIVGPDIFFYFGLAFVFFLLPSAVIAGWFSKQSHEGIYGWVAKSLGKEVGFIAIWFQWLQNILIYPTFFSFIAGAALYCIDPKLIEHKGVLFVLVNCFIWSLTLVNVKGISLSHRLTVFCSLVGLVIPFILIIGIGLFNVIMHPQLLELATPEKPDTWTSLTAIILSFCGIEIAAVHIQDSKLGAFPKALSISVCIIFITMLLGALTLAMMFSPQQLNFISGIPELFRLFFSQQHLGALSVVVNVLIVVGAIGCANSWLLAPSKGLLFASQELNRLGNDIKSSTNRLLYIQACSISLLSTLFLMMNSINSSYWVMITLATQMYMLMYILMFTGAIRLACTVKSQFYWLIVLFSLIGLVGIGIILVVTLNPPSSLHIASPLQYAVFLMISLLFMTFTSVLGKKMIYSKHRFINASELNLEH